MPSLYIQLIPLYFQQPTTQYSFAEKVETTETMWKGGIYIHNCCNIVCCINGILPCYFTVVPIWPKSYHNTEPKGIFLCYLVHHTCYNLTKNDRSNFQFSPLDSQFFWLVGNLISYLQHSRNSYDVVKYTRCKINKPNRRMNYQTAVYFYRMRARL